MYVTEADCGRMGEFSNYQRGIILGNIRRGQRTYSGLVHGNEDVDSGLSVDLISRPPAYDIDEIEVARIATTEAGALNDVYANTWRRCQSDCGDTFDPGEHVVAGADVAAVSPNLQRSVNFGETWAATAADPIAAAFNVAAVTAFPISKTGYRILAGREGLGGAVNGEIDYTDDYGATAWNTTTLPGGALGHGPTYGKGLFSLDRTHIWLACNLGFIYKSIDGGLSFIAKESAVIHAASYYFVNFCDKTYGIAGGAAGVIALSDDGGESWQAGGIAVGASLARCGVRLDKNTCWIGTDAGLLWRSLDGGLTWANYTTFGASILPAGAIRSMSWLNKYQGFVLINVGGVGKLYVTQNGGYTWDYIITPTNGGLNSIQMINSRLGYAVGELQAATAVILKIQAFNR